MNICFGLLSSFDTLYVNSEIVARYQGVASVGLFGAVVPATAAVVSLPLAMASRTVGKTAVCVLGGVAFAAEAALFASFTDAELGLRTENLVCIYLLHGVGRGVWEGVFKGLYADYFGGASAKDGQREAAFGSLIFVSGGAGAFGFFAFGSLERSVSVALLAVASLAAIAGVFGAHLVHTRCAQAQYDQLDDAGDGERI
jgi:hypothetical protein